MLTNTPTVVRKSQDRRALVQKQGRLEEAAGRAEDRIGPITNPKDRWGLGGEAHKDVRTLSIHLPLDRVFRGRPDPSNPSRPIRDE